MTPRRALLLTLALGLAPVACDDGGGSPGVTQAPDDLKGDRPGAPKFVPIRADVPFSAGERARLVAALEWLKKTAASGSASRQRRLAGETLARVESGAVRIGSLASARGMDLWHMCKDLDDAAARAACPAAPVDAGWADAAVLTAVTSELDGYMWGNRLYLAIDPDATDPAPLGTTLVHEVNHILNRSECWYYADYFAHVVEPSFAWLEEYRAFTAECVLKRGSGATALRCDDYALGELEAREYGFAPDLAFVLGDEVERGTRVVAEHLFAEDGAFGVLVPTAAAWPDDFSECQAP